MSGANNDYPEAVVELIEILRRLPGVGKRSAERMALALLKFPADELKSMGQTIAALPEMVGNCPICGNLTAAGENCPICDSSRRDESVICVVEDFTRINAIEKSGAFNGLYHVLGGRISPLDEEYEDSLRITQLEKRLAAGQVKELILALGSDIESRATILMHSEVVFKIVDIHSPILHLLYLHIIIMNTLTACCYLKTVKKHIEA